MLVHEPGALPADHHPAASAPAPPQAAVDAAQETSQLSLSEAVASEEKTTKVTTLEAYKQLLVVALQDNRISADEKRLVRRFRQQLGLSVDQHAVILGQIGWSEEDYEDGVKRVTDFELQEEARMLQNGERGVVWLSATQGGPDGELVFSRVCSKFFQTMACSQGNFVIQKVGVIVNGDLGRVFEETRGDDAEGARAGRVGVPRDGQ